MTFRGGRSTSREATARSMLSEHIGHQDGLAG